MIVNHKYKFIFIKSFKTAGTSLEIALSKFCGDEDILTPIVEKDEKLRSNLNFIGPQNYGDMEEHMTASEIKKKLGNKIFNNYFKFVVVRNPYDQIISAFYWHNESKKNEKKFYIFKKKPISFYNFFTRKAHHIFEDEIERYTENGKILIDKFVRYENLKTDLTEITKILNLPENIYEVFKNIKAKSNINPPIEKRVKLTQDYKNQIKILAKKIIKLHKYKT
ncbi:sulfotransferase family protein [Candidatus Pelagibacter sp.]|nr:sulfotransferase family protein [Candidatus Pelagibacter sp.]